jgi:hypothetical protein
MSRILSIAEWESLEVLPIPKLVSENEKGTVYTVLKVGVLFAKNATDYKEKEHKEYLYLPTITVGPGVNKCAFRLPLSLSAWAFDQVALTHSGDIAFPAEVEFGVLNDRVYAEYIL